MLFYQKPRGQVLGGKNVFVGPDLLALGALGGELLLEAGDAVHVGVVGDDERTTADL